jgi:hypothetical protein
MKSSPSPVFHAMMAAIGASKYDVDNGCIDVWNGNVDSIPNNNFTNLNMEERGFDNFYIELSKYADELSEHYKKLTALNGDEPDECYDGLFSIEVSTEFGEWFAKYVQEYGCAPEKTVALAALQELVDKYVKGPDLNDSRYQQT